MRKSKFPIFIENSKVPVWLSKVAPIEIYAISFGFWVWSRYTVNTRQRNHETIHYQQQLELGFLFQWVLYGLFWAILFVRYLCKRVPKAGAMAYRANPFEREAYEWDVSPTYLDERVRYKGWLRYVPTLWRSDEGV